jgi:hypothetical protein
VEPLVVWLDPDYGIENFDRLLYVQTSKNHQSGKTRQVSDVTLDLKTNCLTKSLLIQQFVWPQGYTTKPMSYVE